MLDEFLFSQYFISQNGYKITKLYYITATHILPVKKTPKPYSLSVLKISSLLYFILSNYLEHILLQRLIIFIRNSHFFSRFFQSLHFL